MGRDATLRLAEQGVKIVGTDAWSWDAPFSHTAKKWEQDKDPSIRRAARSGISKWKNSIISKLCPPTDL